MSNDTVPVNKEAQTHLKRLILRCHIILSLLHLDAAARQVGPPRVPHCSTHRRGRACRHAQQTKKLHRERPAGSSTGWACVRVGLGRAGRKLQHYSS